MNCARSIIKTESVTLELFANKIETLTLESCYDKYIVASDGGY